MPERLLGESLEGRDPKERALTEPDEGQAMPEQLLGEPLEPGNLPDPGIEPVFPAAPALQVNSL